MAYLNYGSVELDLNVEIEIEKVSVPTSAVKWNISKVIVKVCAEVEWYTYGWWGSSFGAFLLYIYDYMELQIMNKYNFLK